MCVCVYMNISSEMHCCARVPWITHRTYNTNPTKTYRTTRTEANPPRLLRLGQGRTLEQSMHRPRPRQWQAERGGGGGGVRGEGAGEQRLGAAAGEGVAEQGGKRRDDLYRIVWGV